MGGRVGGVLFYFLFPDFLCFVLFCFVFFFEFFDFCDFGSTSTPASVGGSRLLFFVLLFCFF